MGGSKRSRTPSAKCLEAVSNLEAKKRKSSPKPKLTRGTTLAALVSKTEPKLRPVSRTKAKASNKKASPKARKKAAKKEEEPVLTLFYWDGRGLMEVARQMLAHSGKTAGVDFVDFRLGFTDTDPHKDVGSTLGNDWHWNLTRMPMISHNGSVIGQSSAINRYLAGELGLAGKNAVETAQIDCLMANLADMQEAYYKLLPYGNTFDAGKKKQLLSQWFNTPVPTEGRDNRYIHWFLGHMEKVVGNKGFAVGNAATLADALLYNKLGDTMAKLEGGKGEPYTDGKQTKEVLKVYPKISKILKKWESNKGVKAWLTSRPTGLF